MRMFAIRGIGKSKSPLILDHDAESVVRDLADRCFAMTCCQLGADVEKMSPAELWGYARARTTPTVRRLVRQRVAEGRLHPRVASDVLAWAVERTAHMIVRQQMMRPIAKAPLPLPSRAAA
jgi:hypothetical protein